MNAVLVRASLHSLVSPYVEDLHVAVFARDALHQLHGLVAARAASREHLDGSLLHRSSPPCFLRTREGAGSSSRASMIGQSIASPREAQDSTRVEMAFRIAR